MKRSDLICLYCGKQTTANEPSEHIFPENVGGDVKLSKGDVCAECNNKLSNLDKLLKIGNYYMMEGYQQSNYLGKNSSKTRRKRQKREKSDITDERKKITIKRNEGNGWTVVKGQDFKDHPNFKKALFKIACNLLCDQFGSIHVRKEYGDLIEFVLNNTDCTKFSYLVSYRSMRGHKIIARPDYIGGTCNASGRVISICFIMTAGIFVLKFKPQIDIITYEDKIIKAICKKTGFDEALLISQYGYYLSPKDTQRFGRLQFMQN